MGDRDASSDEHDRQRYGEERNREGPEHVKMRDKRVSITPPK
jgi:hypothetical protein